jgi:hypothetical protein
MFLKFAKFAKLAKNILYTCQTRIHQNVAICGTRRHSPKAIFEKNVTRLAKFVRVILDTREFGPSSHCLILINNLRKLTNLDQLNDNDNRQ